MVVHLGHSNAVGEDELGERWCQAQANGALVIHL